MVKKILKYFGLAILLLLGAVLIFVSISIAPIDHTPLKDQPHYSKMSLNIAEAEIAMAMGRNAFMVGYGKKNITPHQNIHMAGSGLSRAYHVVHDSIYARTMAVYNGSRKVFLVSLDMLLVPPSVIEALSESLVGREIKITDFYFTATHTHSSIGGWGNNLAGEIYAGEYREEVVKMIAERILESCLMAEQDLKSATLYYQDIPISGILYNRLADENGTIDSLLRVIKIEREDSSKLVVASFTGHATCLSSHSNELSRDYPGILVDQLEQNGYDFAMFMAGAVGSHGCKGKTRGWERAQFIGDSLASAIIRCSQFYRIKDSVLARISVPLELGEPQLRISENWRVRPWLFNAVFEPSSVSITSLRIGNIVLLGAPCDYSGELTAKIDGWASDHGIHSMVTSFNGGYMGYITLDSHYAIKHYETREMNWFGPGNGAYVEESLLALLRRIAMDP